MSVLYTNKRNIARWASVNWVFLYHRGATIQDAKVINHFRGRRSSQSVANVNKV